jgi:hypothetical protein
MLIKNIFFTKYYLSHVLKQCLSKTLINLTLMFKFLDFFNCLANYSLQDYIFPN